MLGRLGFTGRLISIVLLALLALQAIGAGIGYVARKRQDASEALTLLPARAAAIVDILDRSAPADRKSLLAAMSSETLTVAVSPSPPAVGPGRRRLPAVEWVVAQYLPEVGRKEVVAVAEDRPRRRWRLASPREPLRLAIALESGEYAVFETHDDIAPRVFGLPPGFFIGALGALVGIAVLMAIWREAVPLRELAASAARFSGDALPDPVKVRGAPEIRKLIAAVNDMQARIAALVKGRTLFLGAVSHDLKTFITRLRLRAEAVEDEDHRARIVRDLDDMTALLDDALAVARGAAAMKRRERVDIGELAGAAAKELSAERIAVRVMPPGASSVVSGDSVALRRLFTNLFDNALRYGTSAEVVISPCGGTVEITIDDDGPGIAPEDREAAFEPFYRVERSRSRSTGGTGLGLAIARQVVEAHGGTIAIGSAPAGGARVLVRLPAAT